MQPGDPIFYAPDPLLFGEMEVGIVHKSGLIDCIVDPDSKRPSFEQFTPAELSLAPIQLPKAA